MMPDMGEARSDGLITRGPGLWVPRAGDDRAGLVRLPSGLFVTEDLAEEYRRERARPTCVDAFSGAGGFSLGFVQAGWDVLAALDAEAECAWSYMYNLGSWPSRFVYVTPDDERRLARLLERAMKQGGVGAVGTSGGGWRSEFNRDNPNPWPGCRVFFLGDIRRVGGAQVLDALGLKPGGLDCLIGGPPCQGFSTAGRRHVIDPRNSLVFEFARLVLELQPVTFALENVPGMRTMVTPDGVPVIDAFCLMLEKGGWSSFEALKRALAGVPGARAAVRAPKGGARGRTRRKAAAQAPTLFGGGGDE